jgi:hypothetical protein
MILGGNRQTGQPPKTVQSPTGDHTNPENQPLSKHSIFNDYGPQYDSAPVRVQQALPQDARLPSHPQVYLKIVHHVRPDAARCRAGCHSKWVRP